MTNIKNALMRKGNSPTKRDGNIERSNSDWLILCLLAIIHNDSKYSHLPLIKSRLCYLPVLEMILFVRLPNFIIMAIAGLAWALLMFGKGGKFLMAVVSIAAGCALAVPATSFVNSVIFGAMSAMSERSLMILT
jgi:hypothetical protein